MPPRKEIGDGLVLIHHPTIRIGEAVSPTIEITKTVPVFGRISDINGQMSLAQNRSLLCVNYGKFILEL